MDKKTFEKIQDRYEADEDNQKLFQAYDDMDKMVWDPPSNLLKDWVRVRKSTLAHDSLKQMENIFDSHNPKWEIMPLGEADTDRAEELETWLEYHAAKANLNGETSPFRKGLHNSGKFNRVIFEVDYLPYWLPKDKSKWTKEQKANSINGPFCFTAHDPRTMYYEIGQYGLKWISNINNVDGTAIIDHWEIYQSDLDDGKKIKSGVEKIKKVMEEEDDVRFIYVDFTSVEERYVGVFKTTDTDTSRFCEMEYADAIVILDSKNELGFIPYAVATGDSDALLHSLHVSGTWENQNILDTVIDSSTMRRAFFPLLKHSSPTGKDLDINYDGSQDVIEMGMGEDAQTLNPPPIDIGLQQLSQNNTMRMGQAVGIKNLGMMDIAGNVQFSTVQAQIQLQLTALQPYKRTVEKALSHLALIMFRWVKIAGGSEAIAYRTQKRVRKEGQVKGEQILVTPDDFDPDVMLISCELLSNSPTDKQQMVNMFSTLKQSGAQVPWGELLERLGLGSPEILKEGWLKEQIEGAALKNFVDQQNAQLQLQVQQQQMGMQAQMQQAQMQQQQQMQQQAQAQQMQANQQDAIQSGGQENNPAAGGQPAMMNNPGLTRNNVRNPG